MDCYLDYNAEAPIKPAVRDAMRDAMAEVGNPSSVHGYGRQARRAMEQARERVAALAAAEPGDVIFTSSGTEANNLALKGAGRDRLLISAIEHDSVRGPAPHATILAVDGDGILDLDALEATLAEDETPALVSVMLANNETGVIQPVAEAARIAHAHGALLHCDAVQAPGRLAIDRVRLGADLLSLSAHKMGGPQGVGALILGDGLAIAAQLAGGRQETGRRAGSENMAGIVGFGVAAALAEEDLADVPRIANLRDRLETEICALGGALIGNRVPRLCNTACIAMPTMPSETQVIAFDLAGVAVSAGSACSSGKVGPSHVLEAMGLDRGLASRAVRISLGWRTSVGDVVRVIDVWSDLRSQGSGSAAGHEG
jgi:cysteine desulfurase